MTDALDDLYGVVLSHVYGGPLLWSPQHQGWLRRRQLDHELEWADEPVVDDLVDADEHLDALMALREFKTVERCPGCRARPRPETHYIALDVLGEPTVYCVQRPSYGIVGGGGVKKHVGGPAGCVNVRMELLWGSIPELGRDEIVGALPYGQPLPADEVLLRDWCVMCAREARRINELRDDGEDMTWVWQEHTMRLWTAAQMIPDRRGRPASPDRR